MADNWANWYSGNMAPPNKLPSGSYVPAPSVSQPMTVEQMYQGIYGAPQSDGGLTTRSVRTVQIDPYTGRPVASAPTVTPSGSANSALGAIANATGSMRASPVYQPNNSINAYKTQDRLPAQPVGLSLAGVGGTSGGGAGAMGQGGGNLALYNGAPSPEMIERVNASVDKRIAEERAAINRGLGIYSNAMGRMANWFTPATSLTGSGSQPPLVPGPRYVPQPVSGDPWAGMRSMGQGAAQMPGYGAAPGAPQQQPALGLLDMILGPGAGSGLAGLLSGAPRSAPSMYSPSPGTYLPTKAPSGKERRRDADSGSSSVYGSGGSLV